MSDTISRTDEELRIMRRIAMLAGSMAQVYFGKDDLQVYTKVNDTPVTIADRIANTYILEQLQQLLGLSLDRVLSEEKEAGQIKHDPLKSAQEPMRVWLAHEKFNAGDHHKEYWTVDPVDGTRDFENQKSTYSVMIGKVVNGVPVKGVVYQPYSQTEWFAVRGKGAWIKVGEGPSQRLHVSRIDRLEDATIVLSRKYKDGAQDIKREAAEAAWWKETIGVKDVLRSGSFGIKAVIVCQQQADCYINESNEAGIWDVAPAMVIVEEAGGRLTTRHGDELSFDPRNGWFLRDGALCTNGLLHKPFLDNYLPFAAGRKN